MHSNVHKWGNSLGIRIPMAFAREAGLEDGSPVDITIDEGSIIITPDMSGKYHLEDLLEDITPSNLHGEIDTGDVVRRL
ncbi:MAG: AbrB/MazE/SpoVT family DNA-binding domain-containing protein [Ignavibacteria bacterium]|nr:MAG: AbrB/MazE/SpoVT family DNA-binding domain-containing protein [Ignavibacteria bacterium]